MTMGDADVVDSHMTDDQIPRTINDVTVGMEVFYPVAKELRATITASGWTGKLKVTPRITEL
jgi:hypothetical protein